MKRRRFIALSAALPLLGSGIAPDYNLVKDQDIEDKNFKELIIKMIKQNDLLIPGVLKNHEANEKSPDFGGVHDAFGLFNAGSTAGLISRLTLSFASKESDYYLSPVLTKAMTSAARYLLKIQHVDGTIDLLSTNFRSTPDTGFVVEPLCTAYTLLTRTESEGKTELLRMLEMFLKKAGEAFIVGGVHTPNHRWVVCMALSRLNALFPDQRYISRIDEWLSEGIDIDPDGQFFEHSTLIYTPLTNRCLITIGKLLNRPELFDPVRKNLEMTLYYVHPNGEVATEASGRQDQYQVGTMEGYHLSYRYLAILDKNPRFAGMAGHVEKTLPEKLTGYLAYYLEDSTYEKPLPEAVSLPDSYIKEFPYSHIVRIRRGNADASILAKNPAFFTLSKGKAVLASVRMASAFFGRGQFIAPEIKRQGDVFILEWEFTWGYFQPYPQGEKPDYTAEFDIDRKRRKMSEVQKLFARIIASETNGVFELSFNVEGVDHVPLAIELGFRNGGKLEGVAESENEKGSYLLDKGNGTYSFENDTIEFGPGDAPHSWTRIRGGLPRPDAMCVYITGKTPFKKIIKFR